MRRRHLPPSHGNHPNVTPLIDIVMCLIVFFMLVAKIGVNTGADASIVIPATRLGTELKDPGQALILNVSDPDPKNPGVAEFPLVTALVDASGSKPEAIQLVDRATNIRPLLEVLKRIKQEKPDLKIIIRGDAEMGYKYLEPVLITCVEAKVKNVNFNTSIERE